MHIKGITSLKSKGTLVKGGLYSLFSFFDRGVGFVLLVILANYIAPSEYGQLSLFNTILTFIGYFIALSTEGYIEISFFKDEEGEYKKDITFVSLLSIVVGLVLVIILLSFRRDLENLLKLPSELIAYAIIISIFAVYFRLCLSYYRVSEKIVNYGLLSCGFVILNFVLSLVFVITLDKNWQGRIYAELITYLLVIIIVVAYFVRFHLYGIQLKIERCIRLLKWGVPLIPHLATSWLRQGCDRYIINYHYTLADVGLFSFALNLVNVIEAIGAAFNSTNSVTLFKILSDKTLNVEEKKRQLNRQTKLIFAVYFVAALIVVVFVCVFVPLVLPKYVGALPFFIILSGYGFLRCIYFLYCNYLFYWSKTRNLMYITFISSVVHLGCSFFLTKYSLFITASIYSLTQLGVLVLVYIESKRLISKNL